MTAYTKKVHVVSRVMEEILSFHAFGRSEQLSKGNGVISYLAPAKNGCS